MGSLALGLLLFALSSCARLLDADQERLCRTIIPAINAAGASIQIVRVTPPGQGTGQDRTLRIVYRVQEPGAPARTRFVACGFGDVLSGRQELLTVRTDSGPLSETALHFLQRFYLGDPESALEDPGDPGVVAGLPTVSPLAAFATQNLLNALPQIGVYGLLAAAYSLIYGLAGRIVFGFGEFAAIGGYGALIGVTLTLLLAGNVPLVGLTLGLGLALFAALSHGVVAGRVVVSPLVRAAGIDGPGLPVLIASTGLMIALSEYQRILQGSALRWLPPILNSPLPLMRSGEFVVTVTPVAILASGLALLAAVATLSGIRLSGFGRQWRALADDPGAAALFGVDRNRVFALTFALSSGLAGLAGFIVTAYYGGVGYGYGLTLGLKALVAAVVGGIGSVGGAFAGGVVIGIAEVAWSATMPIESRDIAIYALLSIMLTLRPGGLMGYRDLLPRRV